MCRIVGHEWYYDKESILQDNQKYTIINTRICRKCLIKQKAIHGSGSYNSRIGSICTWVSTKLNTDEDRHKKLKELGI